MIVLLSAVCLLAGCRQGTVIAGEKQPETITKAPPVIGEQPVTTPEIPFVTATPEPTKRPQKELYLADAIPPQDAVSAFGALIKAHTQRLSDEELMIAVYPGGVLGDNDRLLKRLAEGEIDLVILPVTALSGLVPECKVFDAPLLFAGHDAGTIDSVLNGENAFREAFDRTLDEMGYCAPVILQAATFPTLLTDRVAVKAADLKAKRLPETGNAADDAFFRAAGLKPQALGTSTVDEALEFMYVSALAGDTVRLAEQKRFELQTVLNRPQYRLTAYVLLVRKAALALLNKDCAEALEQGIVQAAQETAAIMAEAERKACEKLSAEGVTVAAFDTGLKDDLLGIKAVAELIEAADAASGGMVSTVRRELERTENSFLPDE